MSKPESLTAIKGVGRWTVEMLLIFTLGRPDVLPVHDLRVRKGFQFACRKRRLPEPEQLAPIRPPVGTAADHGGVVSAEAADFLNGEGW